MAKTRTTSHAAAVAAAAQLAAQGLDQQAIGKRLGGVSQTTVSRLLHEAEQKHEWLKRSPVFLEDRVPMEVREEARRVLFTHNLVEDFHRYLAADIPLREVVVFDSGGTGDSEEDYLARLRKFGRGAATRVAQLLKHVDTAGVSWGRTLLHVIRGLADVCASPRSPDKPIEFVPLCCEPLGNANVEASSSRLATQLNKIVNGGKGPEHSFTGLPAFTPKGFKIEERAAVEKLIRSVSSYAKVFPPVYTKASSKGAKQPTYLVDKLELVLTSLAPAYRLLGYSEDKWDETGFNRPELQRLAIGDIGGILIEKQGLTAAQKRKVTECNNAWTGATLSQLRKVPATTRAGHPAGLVVAAIGKNKAQIVIEAVKLGVHELLIDGDLANELRRIMAR